MLFYVIVRNTIGRAAAPPEPIRTLLLHTAVPAPLPSPGPAHGLSSGTRLIERLQSRSGVWQLAQATTG